jgi:hypothetical protein
MPKRGEQIKFLVFREEAGRWQIVGEYTVQTMAEEHLHDLKRAGYQAGMVRVRTRMPTFDTEART